MTCSATIHFADDAEGMLTTMAAVLEQERYPVIACWTGQVLVALKKVNPDLAFIMMTGYATVESALEEVMQGACAYNVAIPRILSGTQRSECRRFW